jgi:trans-2,3-dihydro-3-hydroxyanthranilate isomerase
MHPAPLAFVTLDVFTDRRFGGNPLAVVFDPQARLDTARMQTVAREFNLSETTFVRSPRDPAHDAEVRIFTPTREMPWAGHPNVGTAWALALQDGGATDRVYRFEELLGVVNVRVTADGRGLREARVTAPQDVVLTAAPDAASLAQSLGLGADDVDPTAPHPVAAAVGIPFPMLALRSRSALAKARPDTARMAELLPRFGLQAVVAYTTDTNEGDHFDGQPSDLSLRMFAPMMGIPEDPATGSAVVSLSAWLAQREIAAGRCPDGTRRLRIAQGVDFGRPSLLVTEVQVASGCVQSVSVGGACVPVMRGTIEV